MPRKTFQEFKKYIARGSVINLAVGIVSAAIFSATLQSLVKNIDDPLLGV